MVAYIWCGIRGTEGSLHALRHFPLPPSSFRATLLRSLTLKRRFGVAGFNGGLGVQVQFSTMVRTRRLPFLFSSPGSRIKLLADPGKRLENAFIDTPLSSTHITPYIGKVWYSWN